MKQSYLQIKTGLPISSLVSSEDVTSLTALLSNFLYFPHVTGLGGQVGALFKLLTAASTLFPTPYPLNTHTHTLEDECTSQYGSQEYEPDSQA